MSRWHINEKGEPGICRAKSAASCPLGEGTPHGGSKEEARELYEKKQSGETFRSKNKKRDDYERKVARTNTIADAPGGTKLKKDVSYTFVANDGYVLSDNCVVIDAGKIPEEDQEDFLENPEDYVDDYGVKVREVKSLKDFDEPVLVESGTGAVPSNIASIYAVPVSSVTEEEYDEALSNDKSAVELGWNKGIRLFETGNDGSNPDIGQDFPEGKTKYSNAVIGYAQGAIDKDSHGFTNYTLIIPEVPRLTDRKALEIADALWSNANKDPKVWERASDTEKLKWVRSRIGRYGDVTVESDANSVGYSTDTKSAVNYPKGEIKLFNLNKE